MRQQQSANDEEELKQPVETEQENNEPEEDSVPIEWTGYI